TTFLTLIASLILKTETVNSENEQVQNKTWLTLSLATLAILSWWSALNNLSVTDSIRSPWLALSPTALLAIFASLLLVALALYVNQAKKISVILLAVIFFASVSLTAFIFPLGYGFDPFIHRATVQHILDFGTIVPKPLYYIGQYALELIAVNVFTLPLKLVDLFLVPGLSAILIITSAVVGFETVFPKKPLTPLLALFLLPLSAFIITTPQSLAYIYTLVLLFLSLPILAKSENAPSKWLLALFASSAIITHPLAGIPTGIYFVLVFASTLKTNNRKIKAIGTGIIAFLGSISLPLVFLVQAKQANLDVIFNLRNIFNFNLLDLSFNISNRFSTISDGLYLVIDNIFWLLLLFGLIGTILLYRKKAPLPLMLPAITAGIWFINYWLLSTTLEFSFLIEYERANYSDRLLTLTMIFLIPVIGIFILETLGNLKNKPRILSASFILLLTLIGTANVYGAYPRHDNYARSSGFNVSQNDLNAVWEINKIGGEDDYVVLANQAVSAAALESFGFKKYYKENIFYYPIPTGDKLYQLFLEAIKEPSQENMVRAMDLTGVNKAFLVINDYWWQSEQVSELAKNTANEWFSVGDGAIKIFIFER
ncbi:hypothetical protein COY25_04555, partial [Candidatus Uhrbacteria bacterium CG_4_10_14_0_2_um_filter_41_7]